MLASAASASASGDEPAKRSADQALTLGHAGLRLYEEGRFEEALAKFAEAQEKALSPVFGLYRARCLRALGRWLAAREEYARVAEITLGADAPAVWQSAVTSAASEHAEVEAKLPSVRVSIIGGVRGPYTLTVGEQTLVLTDEPFVVELDPGTHTLTVRDRDEASAATTLTIAEGEKLRILELTPAHEEPSEETAAPRGPTAQPTRASSPAREYPARPPNYAAWTSLGLGSGALIVGGVALGMALVKRNAVLENCDGKSCLVSDRDEADSARRFANVATAGFVVGAVTLATSAVLFSVGTAPNAPVMVLEARPGAVTVSARF
jgi:hypothetical protein